MLFRSTEVIGSLSRSDLVFQAEEQGKTLLEVYPNSDMAKEYRELADRIMKACQEEKSC